MTTITAGSDIGEWFLSIGPVEAMRKAFDSVAISGTIVIGEGEMDDAPMLYIGERVGAGRRRTSPLSRGALRASSVGAPVP